VDAIALSGGAARGDGTAPGVGDALGVGRAVTSVTGTGAADGVGNILAIRLGTDIPRKTTTGNAYPVQTDTRTGTATGKRPRAA
jgi:hypothetical protein